MFEIFTYFLGIMVTFPVLVTISFYFLFKKIWRNKKQAIHASMQYSALFYVLSVLVIVQYTFDSSYLGLLIIILLVVILLFIAIQWKLTGDIIFKRVWQLFLRTVFLLFFCGYVILIIIALLLKLIN